jgi:DNA invertase Pin-like site-specific DNA recombinase
MKEEGKGLLAVGYAKIGRSGEMRDLDRQAEQIYNFCLEHGIRLNLVLSEQGERGMSWKILEDMLKESNGRLDMVVVAEMGNLSRDVGWLLLKQAEFENRYGVELISVRGSQLIVDKSGEMRMG